MIELAGLGRERPNGTEIATTVSDPFLVMQPFCCPTPSSKRFMLTTALTRLSSRINAILQNRFSITVVRISLSEHQDKLVTIGRTPRAFAKDETVIVGTLRASWAINKEGIRLKTSILIVFLLPCLCSPLLGLATISSLPPTAYLTYPFHKTG
jgi:hypothetical protein